MILASFVFMHRIFFVFYAMNPSGGHPMESVSHGLLKEKRWGGVPSFIKEHKSANLSLNNLLHFCMEDSKNPIVSR
jgi:hypothetical protein